VSRAAEIDEAKLRDVNRWRDSDVCSPLERLVLEYAECLTRTPADVSDDLRSALRQHLNERQLVEITTAIAWENFRARFNRGFDVQPQGYAEGAYCVLPDRGNTATDS
jgi:alkylhydroperoxidase family enzyme